PCFYIKRGDQASIIGGVIEFIKELHHVLQALESKKQRMKSVSPRAPVVHHPQLDQRCFGHESFKEIGASCNSPLADVEAKISGPNVVLKVISRRIPGQVVKIITVLEKLSFEILHLNISSMEDTVLCSFVIKIGLECHLSLEELALEVQQSFYSESVHANDHKI
ncbi:transcription factor MUTE, partial [Carica papaya]|uniref:transcription factor MUTE n=1 Tax=Carica papaya TaxID=3649 RepID=UPI000B8C8E77